MENGHVKKTTFQALPDLAKLGVYCPRPTDQMPQVIFALFDLVRSILILRHKKMQVFEPFLEWILRPSKVAKNGTRHLCLFYTQPTHNCQWKIQLYN